MMGRILPLKLSYFILIALALVSFLGLARYPGAVLPYLFFDVSWLVVLLLALVRPVTYMYFLVAGMLFLGFWAKCIAYLGFSLALIDEPMGDWLTSWSPVLWDRVLTVGAVAACALITVNLVTSLLSIHLYRKTNSCVNEGWFSAFYIKYRAWIWVSLFSILVCLNILNWETHFFSTGLKPRWAPPFHLSVLFMWVLSFFGCLGFAFLLGADKRLKVICSDYWIILLFIAAACTAATTLSRAVFVFWTAPCLVCFLASNSPGMWVKQALKSKLVIFAYVVLFALTLGSVAHLRAEYYHPNSTHHSTHYSYFGTKLWMSTPLKFVVGRWVGLEAVMATTVYPHGGMKFFANAWLQKPKANDRGLYTLEVLSKGVKQNTEFVFGFLPGVVGLLNFSQSLAVIFIGLFLMFGLANLLEIFTASMLAMPVYCSVQAMILGYWCFSGLNTPYLGLVNCIEIVAVSLLLIAFVKLINWYGSVKRRLRPTGMVPIKE